MLFNLKQTDKINLTKFLVENRFLWHICFWIFYIVVQARGYYNTVMYYDIVFLHYMLSAEILYVFIVYLTLFLYNYFIPKKKVAFFFIVSFCCWMLFVMGQKILQKYFLNTIPEVANINLLTLFFNSISDYLIHFLFIIFVKYFKDNFIFHYYENLKKEQQIQFELQNLKAQISPHFLFNTMNNFYGLAVENSAKLPNLMLQLSELLRYSLYETNHKWVTLQQEINYLKNYVELEKIRLEDTVIIEFNTQEINFENYKIAPLLLVVFVENAFKHAKTIGNKEIFIKINFVILHNDILNFKVENNFDNIKTNNLEKPSGIGLENVKKRLNVLYPNELHNLNITNTDEHFKASLLLKLY